MTSKKTLYKTAEAYRLGWKKCREDNAELHTASVRRIEKLEQTVDSQKEYIVAQERLLREAEDTVSDLREAVGRLKQILEVEAEVHAAGAAEIRKKLEFVVGQREIPFPSSTVPTPDLS